MQDFEQVYTEYYNIIHGYCFHLCRDPHVAEELTQETFFRALKSIHHYRGECKLSVWLCQIAKNTYFSMQKKQKHIAQSSPEDLPSASDMEYVLIDKETALSVHKALHKLPEPYREVFWLRTFGELDFSSIAELFKKTESWARVTYHRARIKLKEDLK
jgi:RNA polymerase sigma-70 factor (ECF subfamily)